MVNSTAVNNGSSTASSLELVPDTIIIAAFNILILIIGVVGNSMTLLSFIVQKKLRTIPNVYVANLAVMDILICITMCSVGIYPIIKGSRDKVFPYCRLFGFLGVYAIAVSRMLLCCISINRYVNRS